MITLNKEIPKNIMPPIHFRDYHVPLLKQYYEANKPIYITPKIDGVHCTINYESFTYECEKLNDNVYVFDIVNKLATQSIYMTLRTIEKKFGRNMIYQPASAQELLLIVKTFDSCTKEKIIKLKPFFIISNNTFCKSGWAELFDILSNEISMPYLNDGWVIYLDNFHVPLKFKPLKHMTIDILYDSTNKKCYSQEKNEIEVMNDVTLDTNILRCYWENKGWVAGEIRDDKKVPNRQFIITTLEMIHNSCPNYKLLWDSDIYFPYYNHTLSEKKLLSKMTINMITKIRNLTFDLIKKHIVQKDKLHILDIGCGKGKLGKYLSNTLKFLYTGIDVDPITLCNSHCNGVYCWKNINDDKFNFDCKSDYAIFVNSFHYVDNKTDILRKLYDVTDVLLIFGIFEDFYKDEIKDDYVHVKKNGDKFVFDYAWKKRKITEKILNKHDVIDSAEISGWNLKCTEKIDAINDFYSLHELLIFVKSKET